MLYCLRSDGMLFDRGDCSNPAAISISNKFKSKNHAAKAIHRCLHRKQNKAGGYGWYLVNI